MTRSSAPDSTAFLFPGVRRFQATGTSGSGSLSPDVHRELCRYRWFDLDRNMGAAAGPSIAAATGRSWSAVKELDPDLAGTGRKARWSERAGSLGANSRVDLHGTAHP
jgi:hypothetical protein